MGLIQLLLLVIACILFPPLIWLVVGFFVLMGLLGIAGGLLAFLGAMAEATVKLLAALWRGAVVLVDVLTGKRKLAMPPRRDPNELVKREKPTKK